MAVFRVEKNSGYTVMSNHHLRNRALSLKAKGLLSQMLSLPEDWDYTLQGLARINRESIDAIRQAIRELEQAGYIQRSRERDEKGRLRGADYVIFELPQPVPASVSPTLENALPVTCMLVVMAMAWVIIFTVLIAAISVIRKGGIFDNVMRIICIIGICVPSFWLALILLTAFAVQIPIFSVISDGSFKSLILPSAAMAFPIICMESNCPPLSCIKPAPPPMTTWLSTSATRPAKSVLS